MHMQAYPSLRQTNTYSASTGVGWQIVVARLPMVKTVWLSGRTAILFIILLVSPQYYTTPLFSTANAVVLPPYHTPDSIESLGPTSEIKTMKDHCSATTFSLGRK